MNKDSWSGFALLALAAIYYWATGLVPDSTLEDEVGATGLPIALTFALVGLGLILLVRGLVAGRPEPTKKVADDDGETDATFPRAVGFLLFGAAYVLILPYAGYLISIALLIAGVAIYEGAPRRWTVPVAALGGAVLYWAIFVKLLGVNQPAGLLAGLI